MKSILTKLIITIFLSLGIFATVYADYAVAKGILHKVESAYLDEHGRYDIQKYRALAKRSVAERE